MFILKASLKAIVKSLNFDLVSFKLVSIILIICILLTNVVCFSNAIDKNPIEEVVVTDYEIRDKLYNYLIGRGLEGSLPVNLY